MVELIPKKEKAIALPRWAEILFYASIVIFVITILAFLLFWQLKSAAKSDLENISQKIQQVRSPERLALEAELLEIEKRINDVAFLLGSHYDQSKFFTLLEGFTHPKVQFTEISIDNLKSTVKIVGLAQDFTAVEQQFRIFNQSDFFKEVKLSDLSLNQQEGNVSFTLSFTFQPKQIYR